MIETALNAIKVAVRCYLHALVAVWRNSANQRIKGVGILHVVQTDSAMTGSEQIMQLNFYRLMLLPPRLNFLLIPWKQQVFYLAPGN